MDIDDFWGWYDRMEMVENRRQHHTEQNYNSEMNLQTKLLFEIIARLDDLEKKIMLLQKEKSVQSV